MFRRLSLLAVFAALAASPAHADHDSKPAPSGAPRFENIGNVHHPITTRNPEAQRFFDQGLFLVYGFNHDEAVRAFKQAAALDSTCAMTWWGVACAYGPNINWPMDAAQEAKAQEAMAHANRLAKGASEAEQAYIAALALRYDGAPGENRAARDSAYAAAMGALRAKYPDDLDAATLYAEALLDLSPWNQWRLDGTPLPGTLALVEVLESVLKRNPDHVGAIHYYIHATEAGPDRGARALPYAERMSRMKLDAGHLVHMPSHIFQRVGRYAASEVDNVEAAQTDSGYVAKWKPEGVYTMMYVPHNVHFVWAAATMAGRSRQALHYARRLVDMVPPEMVAMAPPMEFWSPTVFYALVRFGRWDDILKEPAPHPSLVFTGGMRHFARGMAYAARKDFARAKAERDSVDAIAASIPPEALVSFNSARGLLTIAAGQLGGEIAARQGRIDDAIPLFERAIALEDTLHYDEPPAWFFPVRNSLGAALLAAGRAMEAEAAFRADLERHPENGWSLNGLAASLEARKQAQEAAEVRKRFEQAWTRADVKLAGGRF